MYGHGSGQSARHYRGSGSRNKSDHVPQPVEIERGAEEALDETGGEQALGGVAQRKGPGQLNRLPRHRVRGNCRDHDTERDRNASRTPQRDKRTRCDPRGRPENRYSSRIGLKQEPEPRGEVISNAHRECDEYAPNHRQETPLPNAGHPAHATRPPQGVRCLPDDRRLFDQLLHGTAPPRHNANCIPDTDT